MKHCSELVSGTAVGRGVVSLQNCKKLAILSWISMVYSITIIIITRACIGYEMIDSQQGVLPNFALILLYPTSEVELIIVL